MSKTARIHTINVQLDDKDKRLLERLSRRDKLPRTEVVRRLIRSAAEQLADLRSVANG